MLRSDSIGKLAAALVAAQADIRAVEKSATNPHFKSKYVPLDAIVAMARPALAKHEIAIAQSAGQSGDGKGLDVETTLIHSSGEWLSNVVYIPLAKQDPQGAGAAVTYGRRFGLSSLLSIASDEDDDGNNASRPTPAKREAAKPAPTRPAPQPAASAADQALGETPTSRLKLNGRFISLMLSDELNTLIAEKGENPTYAKHVAAAKEVLASRTDDARVARIKQEEEAAQSDLKFAGST